MEEEKVTTSKDCLCNVCANLPHVELIEKIFGGME